MVSRLGRKAEAAQAVTELLQLRPDFSTAGRFLMPCYVKFDFLLEAIIEGLDQAGLTT